MKIEKATGNAVQLMDMPGLTKGQKQLYKLICNCLKSGKEITKDDVVHIYENYVMQSSQYHDYHFVNGEREYFVCDKPEWHIKTQSMVWLFRNIGSLVLKGYLTVLPKFDFEEINKLTR